MQQKLGKCVEGIYIPVFFECGENSAVDAAIEFWGLVFEGRRTKVNTVVYMDDCSDSWYFEIRTVGTCALDSERDGIGLCKIDDLPDSLRLPFIGAVERKLECHIEGLRKGVDEE